jgi:hypothetical protein
MSRDQSRIKKPAMNFQVPFLILNTSKHIIGSWIEEYRRIVLKFGQEENKNNTEIVGEAVHTSSNQPV